MATQTIKQLEDSLVQLITTAIGWNAGDERVRIAWQGENAPFIPSAWDCCFIRVTPVSDTTAGYRDTVYTDGTQYTADTAGQRVMQCACIFYGQNAFESADALREWLFSPVSVTPLREAGMELLVRIPEIQRVPELINQKWWERADFSFNFNTSAGISRAVEYIDTPGEITVKINR